MSRFAIRTPYFIVVVCLIDRGGRRQQPGAHAGRHVPGDEHSGGRRGDVLLRHAAGADRNATSPAASSASSRWAAASSTSSRARCPASASSKSTSSRAPIRIRRSPPSPTWRWRNLRRLPPGTLPPVVLKFDASSLPVCLVTFKGEGLERDAAARPRAVTRCATRSPACRARACRSRSAGATGRSWSTPIRYKLEAHQLSLMDVVRERQRLQPDSAGRRRADRRSSTTTSTPTASCATSTRSTSCR